MLIAILRRSRACAASYSDARRSCFARHTAQLDGQNRRREGERDGRASSRSAGELLPVADERFKRRAHCQSTTASRSRKAPWACIPQIGPIPGSGVSLAQGKANFLLSTTTLSQPITQYFKTRAGVDVSRADAAGARADVRRAEDEVAFKVKEVFYSILTTERRRDAVDAQIRAAELRIVETRNAVDTGVALEMKADEVRAQIAQAKHALGQLQDAVADMKQELADLCGLPLDTELELARPDGSAPDPSPEAEVGRTDGSRA